MGKRHLTPAEIKEQCKRIARESRMADRTPWTAMGIICSYVIMRREGFKGQRISRLANKVNEMEADWSAGKIGMKEISLDGPLSIKPIPRMTSPPGRGPISTGLIRSRLHRRIPSMSRPQGICCFSLPL